MPGAKGVRRQGQAAPPTGVRCANCGAPIRGESRCGECGRDLARARSWSWVRQAAVRRLVFGRLRLVSAYTVAVLIVAGWHDFNSGVPPTGSSVTWQGPSCRSLGYATTVGYCRPGIGEVCPPGFGMRVRDPWGTILCFTRDASPGRPDQGYPAPSESPTKANAAGWIEHQASHPARQTAGSARRCASRRWSGTGPLSIGPDQRRSRS
jgi:hypothetical protein